MADIGITKEEIVKRLVDEIPGHCDNDYSEQREMAVVWITEALDAFLTEERETAIRKGIDAEVARVFSSVSPDGQVKIKNIILVETIKQAIGLR